MIESMPMMVDPYGFNFYTDPAFVKKRFGIDELQQIQVKMNEFSKQETIEQIRQILREPQFSDVILYDREQELEQVRRQFMQRFAFLLSAVLIMFFTALLGMVNQVASSLHERRREFSILKAMGSVRWHLFRLIVLEGVLISASGGLVSVVTGALFGNNVLRAMDSPLGQIPFSCLLGAFGMSIMMGLAATIPSAWRFSDLDVVRTVQEEG